MSPLDQSERESIVKRVSFVEVEISDLQDLLPINYHQYSADRSLRRNIERLDEAIADTYRGAVLALGTIGVIDAKDAEKLAGFARFVSALYQILDDEDPSPCSTTVKTNSCCP